MNSVDNNSDQVETLIKAAATTFQPSAEVRDSVRKHLMESETSDSQEPQPQRRSPRRRMLLRSWRLASAASVAVVVTGAIVALLVWPTSLTMAQVQEAVEAVAWIHLQYDTGEEQWISPRERIWAYSRADGSVTFTNYQTGVQHSYRGPRSSQNIFERQLEPWNSPRSAWDVIVGYLEERVHEPAGNGRLEAERHTEIVDGRRLVRFDSYIINALDQRRLNKQIWADPKTRLPVKVRRRLSLGDRQRQNFEPTFATGTYTFPDSGPESIYDLGVPKELIVVKPDTSEPEKEVADLLEAVRAAKHRFLANYRVIVWQNARTSEIDVLHFSGRPQLKETADNFTWMDFRGVKIRQERFFNSESDYPEYHLPLPATAEQVLAWSRTQTPVDLSLSDGERSYSQHGPSPPSYPALEVSVRVRRVVGTPAFTKTHWPTEYQWPDPSRFLGHSIELLDATASSPAGTIWLRSTIVSDRYDYFIDPAHDYICVKQIKSHRINDRWFKRRTVTLSKLVQLPSGHWVATMRRINRPGSARTSQSTWLIDIEEIDPDRIPSDIFDGEKLLENAKKIGATIEAY